LTPAVVPATFTAKVQEALAASVAPETLTVLAPAVPKSTRRHNFR